MNAEFARHEMWKVRLYHRVDRGSEYDDCHLWRGAVDTYGYGKARDFHGKVRGVHIIAWELAHGRKVPEGWHVDHLCRIRRCCNPDHLEAKPQTENTLAGRSFTAVNKAKTHCPRGHEYTPENIRWHSGRRECRICANARDKERRAAQRQADAEASLRPGDTDNYSEEFDD
ncbi:HNH endonuclease signature motif containing protein [Kitasatospora purpeofusca]|uniref:HNH endonuclease signature motif containing protein n=1 Tax=Kitasatospora purpeofusca TaxID=67352 RepID=UPI003698E4DC